jgi:hypothetical protein
MSTYDQEEHGTLYYEGMEAGAPCLATVRDTERFTTHCAKLVGHDGDHSETIPA